MPSRAIAARELAKLFAVFSHPDRLRIVEELRDGERDVNALQDALVVAYRFDHISNGNRLARNPGVNAHMVVVGWSRVQP